MPGKLLSKYMMYSFTTIGIKVVSLLGLSTIHDNFKDVCNEEESDDHNRLDADDEKADESYMETKGGFRIAKGVYVKLNSYTSTYLNFC